MPRKTALPFPFIKTKNVLDDGIKEHCLQLSSLLSEQGSSSVYSKISTNFFLQKEKNLLLLNNQVAMFPYQNLFAFPSPPHRVIKSTHFAIYFSHHHKAHKTRPIQSQGNNRFLQVRSSSHSPERRHFLVAMVL